jgi:hypothetical protein
VVAREASCGEQGSAGTREGGRGEIGGKKAKKSGAAVEAKGTMTTPAGMAQRWSGSDLLVEAEVFFDRGDADFELLAFVDFVLLEFGELGVEAIYLCVKLVDAAIEACLGCSKIVFCRHVLDDVGEHVADFFEGRFLWCHTRGVYHDSQGGACRISPF